MRLETDSLDVMAGGKKLVSGLELSVTSGQCWFVYGRNGAGKTTLLQTLAGLRVPDGGRVLLDGRALPDWPMAALARVRGYLPQKTAGCLRFFRFRSGIVRTFSLGVTAGCGCRKPIAYPLWTR